MIKKQKHFPGESTVISISEVMKDYCKDTTIHGLRYISRDGAHISDRLCWVAAVLTCLVLTGVCVGTAWQQFLNSPVVVNVETTNYPLYKLPFPAITICPAVNVKRRIGEEILARLFNHSLQDADDDFRKSIFAVLSILSDFQYPFYHRAGYHFNEVNNALMPLLDTLQLSNFMMKVLPTCNELFRACHWTGRSLDCCKVFSIQRTEAGFCYSFNSLTSENSKNCSIPDAYFFASTPQNSVNDYTCNPRRNIATGISTGLEVFLGKIPKEDSLGNGQLNPTGAQVLVNHPLVPPDSATSIYVPETPSTFFTIKISPVVTISSAELRRMSLDMRNCLFPSERKSEYFRTYTYQSCLMECRMKHIIKKCNCYPYFFNISEGGVPECKFSQLQCIIDENTNLRVFNPPKGIHIWESYFEAEIVNCSDCLPTCHESSFLVNYDKIPDTNEFAVNGTAHLDIFYKDLGAIKYRRERAFTLMNLVVSFGGFMGLFLGVSLLSGAELIYYLLRICKVLFTKFKINSTQVDSFQGFNNKRRAPRYLSAVDHSSFMTPIQTNVDLHPFKI